MNKNFNLCEKIKKYINDSIDLDKNELITFSIDLEKKFNRKYTFLSKIFVKEYGFSIRNYINDRKINKIKKLIEKNHIPIIDIYKKMHYYSPSHLSHRFKMTTNLTPTQYKNLTQGLRKDPIVIEYLQQFKVEIIFTD